VGWMLLVNALARNMGTSFWWRIIANQCVVEVTLFWLSRLAVRSLFCGTTLRLPIYSAWILKYKKYYCHYSWEQIFKEVNSEVMKRLLFLFFKTYPLSIQLLVQWKDSFYLDMLLEKLLQTRMYKIIMITRRSVEH
jgi:hypothetical protein